MGDVTEQNLVLDNIYRNECPFGATNLGLASLNCKNPLLIFHKSFVGRDGSHLYGKTKIALWKKNFDKTAMTFGTTDHKSAWLSLAANDVKNSGPPRELFDDIRAKKRPWQKNRFSFIQQDTNSSGSKTNSSSREIEYDKQIRDGQDRPQIVSPTPRIKS